MIMYKHLLRRQVYNPQKQYIRATKSTTFFFTIQTTRLLALTISAYISRLKLGILTHTASSASRASAYHHPPQMDHRTDHSGRASHFGEYSIDHPQGMPILDLAYRPLVESWPWIVVEIGLFAIHHLMNRSLRSNQIRLYTYDQRTTKKGASKLCQGSERTRQHTSPDPHSASWAAAKSDSSPRGSSQSSNHSNRDGQWTKFAFEPVFVPSLLTPSFASLGVYQSLPWFPLRSFEPAVFG